MKTARVLVLGLACVIGLGALIGALPLARRAVFCSEIVNPYDLVGGYVVTVPQSEHRRYNDEFVRFARAHGLKPSSGSQSLTEAGGDKVFLNLRTTACDGIVFAWSSNIARPDEFVLSFHSNWLFGSRRAAEVRDAFVAEFRARYRIETEDDDLIRRPVP